VTITYDPHHRKYLDESDVRDELTRVYDLCHGCRLCFKFCSAFPSLFEMIDKHDDQDAHKLTHTEQNQIVDECFQCKLCYVNCPYIPGQSEWELDFPRLMLRADAMLHETGQKSRRDKITTAAIARTDLIGKVSSAVAPIANKTLSKPNSPMRKVIEKVAGVSAQRVLPPFTKQRFSTWFKKRTSQRVGTQQASVILFPTCLVEYQDAAIGKDLVKVYERNGVDVSLCDDTTCCGAPWLHSGDIGQFTKVGAKNVARLAAEVRAGKDIVVPQPTCSYVLKKDYIDYIGGPDAALVAEHTYDASEYLWKLHKGTDTSLDTQFDGEAMGDVTYHTPCHLRAQNIGFKSRDLMKLAGAKVTLVQQCSGMDGMWGMKAGNEEFSLPVAQKLKAELEKAGGDVVAGDCHLANTVIFEQTGRTASHPIQLIARAYGIAETD
jgi:glycerol-3-phosphate dehydrogenase subunit C